MDKDRTKRNYYKEAHVDCLRELQRCEACTTNEDKRDRSVGLGEIASVLSAYMMIDSQAVKHVGKDI